MTRAWKYTVEPVGKDNITKLLKAAMAAPSASNRRSWYFVIVTERGKLDELAEGHPYGKMLFEVPFCITVCGDPGASSRYWVQDCSAATENLLLAAVGRGLVAVQLGVYLSEEHVAAVRDALVIPEGIVPLNLISIDSPAENREPRTQYDEARVHRERW